jgi:hypothetical protein
MLVTYLSVSDATAPVVPTVEVHNLSAEHGYEKDFFRRSM